MELLAPPIPGERLLSLDEIVDREPSYMTSILAGCQNRCPRELSLEPWRMAAEPEEPMAAPASELGTAPGKLPEHLHSSEPSGPKAALFYCPLVWPHGIHPVAPLKSLPVPLPLLPNSPVPYYPTLSPQMALPLSYSSFAWWQKYHSPRSRSRESPPYSPAPAACSHTEGRWSLWNSEPHGPHTTHTAPSLPKECRTSDPRERLMFREGSKVRHKATGCRTKRFIQLDSEGRRAGRWRRRGEGHAVAERALCEYSHIMETLGSEITGRSEVIEEERGKFTEYLNQLCQQKQFVSQVLALIDMHCVWSLLSPDTGTCGEFADGETHIQSH